MLVYSHSPVQSIWNFLLKPKLIFLNFNWDNSIETQQWHENSATSSSISNVHMCSVYLLCAIDIKYLSICQCLNWRMHLWGIFKGNLFTEECMRHGARDCSNEASYCCDHAIPHSCLQPQLSWICWWSSNHNINTNSTICRCISTWQFIVSNSFHIVPLLHVSLIVLMIIDLNSNWWLNIDETLFTLKELKLHASRLGKWTLLSGPCLTPLMCVWDILSSVCKVSVINSGLTKTWD